MRTFTCQCGARVFFVNSVCIQCEKALAYDPQRTAMVRLSLEEGAAEGNDDRGRRRRVCENRWRYDACNWLLPEGQKEGYCASCALSQVIPDLSQPDNLKHWAHVEAAKRYLLYSLYALQLPVVSKAQSDDGLVFRIMEDMPDAPVLTGHASGIITLNVREADPVARTDTRVKLSERYRTVLGHLRHEIGHYYWERLVRDRPVLQRFRALFGDERVDYAQALEQHYSNDVGELENHDTYISKYASAHPWEDWAETWAHYMHMVDTMETAAHFGLVALSIEGAAETRTFDSLLTAWAEVTVALNALNRSMGMPDAYPFAPAGQVIEKLRFVAHVIEQASM